MNRSSRIKDLFVVIFLVGLISGISHFVITNPLGFSRLLYVAQAPIIQWNSECSAGAPDWMPLVQRYATRNIGAPSSQLAHITSEGNLHHCETGWQDGIWGSEKLDPGARFRFASVTKTVTAVAVLDLGNRKVLALDDKIVDVLNVGTSFKDPRVANITIEHLLSHRAGWDRERTQDVMFTMNVKPWCPENPERLLDTKLLYEPGEVESYSNLGYCLLGLVIERVSGNSYRNYVGELFDFDKTGFKFIDGPYLPDEVRYDFRHENFYGEDYYQYFDFQAISSSAGLSGNASDLAVLIANALTTGPVTILDGDVISSCDPSKVQECYGYGLYRYQPNAKTMPLYIHGGKLPGATSAIIVAPDGGVVVWLGAGTRPAGIDALQKFYDFIRERGLSG